MLDNTRRINKHECWWYYRWLSSVSGIGVDDDHAFD